MGLGEMHMPRTSYLHPEFMKGRRALTIAVAIYLVFHLGSVTAADSASPAPLVRRGSAARQLADLLAPGQLARVPSNIYERIRIDAELGDAQSMRILAYHYGEPLNLTNRDRAIYLNVLARLATDGGVADLSLAQGAFFMAMAIGFEKNGLPQEALEQMPPRALSAREMWSVLVGEWAVTDAVGIAKIQDLVNAARVPALGQSD